MWYPHVSVVSSASSIEKFYPYPVIDPLPMKYQRWTVAIDWSWPFLAPQFSHYPRPGQGQAAQCSSHVLLQSVRCCTLLYAQMMHPAKMVCCHNTCNEDDKPDVLVINSTLKNMWIQKMDHCFVWVETLICQAFPTPRFGEPISIWRRRLVSACLNLFNSNKTATELSQNVCKYWYGYWFNSQTFQTPPTNCKTTLQRLGV